MDKKTEGAWLINHTKKLLDVRDTYDFGEIVLAGKSGLFLSNLAASEQSALSKDKVVAIARISSVGRTEFKEITTTLKEAQLIDISVDGSIEVLGLTSTSVLGHTADIFTNSNPTSYQRAALDLAENVSELPKQENILKEYISDTHQLTQSETSDLIFQSEQIGFVDYENIESDLKFYFNGNLFKRNVVEKANKILSSLTSEDNRRILEFDQILSTKGCTSIENAHKILGVPLLSKLQSIGMYDFNEVSNPIETKVFITRPAAFEKYGNPFQEDAFDLAKAFVSSLYYGMNFRNANAGRITMLNALMRKLVNGDWVGPAQAIGEDYKLLELQRVIEVKRVAGKNTYHMRLLKKDIGILALQVLEFGTAVDEAVVIANSNGSVTNYSGPEQQRDVHRRKQTTQTKNQVADMLRTLRV